MIEILGNKSSVNRLVLPEVQDIGEDTYVKSVLNMIGEDRDIEQIRQDRKNETIADVDNATASNLLKGENPEKIIPLYFQNLAVVEQYYKDKKKYELANEEAVNRSFEKQFEENPQALLNYANEMDLDYNHVLESRAFNLQYLLTQQVDDKAWAFDLGVRVASDIGLEAVGHRLKKSPNKYLKAAGYVASSTGAGQAKDVIILDGMSIAQTGKYFRDRYYNILSMDLTDAEFNEEAKKFIKDFNRIPGPYKAEQLDYILTDVSPFADAGGAGTSFGVRAVGRGLYLGSKVKNFAKLYGHKNKITINDGLMKEIEDVTDEKISTNSTTKPDVQDEIDVVNKDRSEIDDQLSKEIDARRNVDITVYRNSPVKIIAGLPTVKVIEPEIIPPSKTTIYEPRSIEEPTIIEAEVVNDVAETVPGYRNLEQLVYRTIADDINDIYNGNKFVRTNDWENRRITYVDNNKGAGYSWEDAQILTLQNEEALASIHRRGNRSALKRKKTSWGMEYEDMEWLDKGYDYDYQVVSAASPVGFTRAANTIETYDTGATGAHYGSGPYASIHAEDPASFAEYKQRLEAGYFHDSLNLAIHNEVSKDEEFVKTLERLFKVNRKEVLTEANAILSEEYDTDLTTGTSGVSNIYNRLKDVKKSSHWYNATDLKPVVKDGKYNAITLTVEKLVNNMLERYKKGKPSVMNYWYGVIPESQPSHWVDQRDGKHLFHDQNREVKTNLKHYNDEVQQLVFKSMRDTATDTYKEKIYEFYVGELDKNELGLSSNIEDIDVFSDQYPLFVRLAMDQFPESHWKNVWNEMEQLSKTDLDAAIDYEELLEKTLYKAGEDMQAELLVKHDIWGNIHSRSNLVFFKQTEAQMSNVYKQSWEQAGYHYDKLLDSGSFPVYDPTIGRFVIHTSIVIPGKGRKPVVLNKIKIKDIEK